MDNGPRKLIKTRWKCFDKESPMIRQICVQYYDNGDIDVDETTSYVSRGGEMGQIGNHVSSDMAHFYITQPDSYFDHVWVIG